MANSSVATTSWPPRPESNRAPACFIFFQLLVYWVGELEFSRPNQPWSVIARLHHRSPGFGLVADKGGSNFLALGVRRRF